MENLVKNKFFSDYKNKRVLLTGHTGFKGSWLMCWLNLLGANVRGYSLNVPTEPSHFNLLDLNLNSNSDDISDIKNIKKVIEEFNPEIIFHMAAQSIVRLSYAMPRETFLYNSMGVVNLFEAVRTTQNEVRAIINITSDKCYENTGKDATYKETDSLGGYDPYSASKACSEIITSSFVRSFFNINEFGKTHNCLIASVRSGNVIGGGDWAANRLLPDIYRGYAKKNVITIKNPKAIRPWQHVLEPLSGYLALGIKLLNKEVNYAEAWNFGPSLDSCVTVDHILSLVLKSLPGIEFHIKEDDIHEAKILMLNSKKANDILGWKPKLSIEQAIQWTSDWYKLYYDGNKVTTLEQIIKYQDLI